MGRIQLFVSGLLLLFIVSMLTFYFDWDHNEQHILDKTQQALQKAGHSWVTVVASDQPQYVKLTGTASSQKEIDQAVVIALAVEGVKRVDSTGLTLPPELSGGTAINQSQSSLAMISAGDLIIITGIVASQSARDMLIQTFKNHFPNVNANALEVDESVSESTWFNAMVGYIPQLTGLDGAGFKLSNDNLSVFGSSNPDLNKENFNQTLRRFKELGLQVNNMVKMVGWKAPSLTILLDAKVVTAAGQLPDNIFSQRVVAAIQSLSDNVNIDQLYLDNQTKPASWMKKLPPIIKGMSRFEQAFLTVKNGEIKLTDVKGTLESENSIVSSLNESMLSQYVPKSISNYSGDGQAQSMCEQTWHSLPKKRTIIFEIESEVIYDVGRALLDKISHVLTFCTDVNLVIDGHADITGPELFNQGLSKRRAVSAMQYLSSKNIAKSRIRTQGHSSSLPIASNDTAAGRMLNRRVEITLEKGVFE